MIFECIQKQVPGNQQIKVICTYYHKTPSCYIQICRGDYSNRMYRKWHVLVPPTHTHTHTCTGTRAHTYL